MLTISCWRGYDGHPPKKPRILQSSTYTSIPIPPCIAYIIWDYKYRKNKQLFVSSSSSLYLYLDTTTINVNHIRQLIEWHHSVERVYILKMQTCKKNKAQMSCGLWRKRTKGRRFRSSHFLFLSADLSFCLRHVRIICWSWLKYVAHTVFTI